MAGVQVRYDEFDNPQYFVNVPTGRYDYEGGEIFTQVPVSASEVKTETVYAPYDAEFGGGASYQQYVVPSSVYQKAVEAVTPPPVPKDYTRPQEVQQSGAFSNQPGAGENVNDFSFGQLGKIYDSINSGAYKVSPDKSQLITPYGDFSLRPIGNGLYDIPIGAKSGGYNVAIGVTDDNQAVFNKDFIDKGAIRYVGGSPGGFISNMLNDLGPVSNIALAALVGPGAGFLTNAAAQTALNAAKGQDFEDALKGGIISGGITSGIGALTGGANLGSMDPADYAGLGSGAGGDYGISSAGALSDIALNPELSVGLASPAAYTPTTGGIDTIYGQGEGAFPGIEPGTVASDVAGSTGNINTIYGQGEGAFPGTEPGTVALDQSMAGMGALAAAGLTGANLLKYAGLAGLAGLAGSALQPKRVITPEGVDQTPVGAGLSPDYKPYRYMPYAAGGITALAGGGYHLGDYSDGGRLLKGPGDGVSDDIPASIGGKQPARLADGEFVIPARIVSEIGNGSTDAGARKLYEMMDRVQSARRKTMGKKQFAKDTKADKYFPA